MDAINPGRLRYFPEYYTQFDTSVVWAENTCTNTVMSSMYKVQLTLDRIVVDDIPGIVPHIAIWDGTHFIEQIEWVGRPYEWLDDRKSDMTHIVGACANAILSEIDQQSWQYVFTISPNSALYTPVSLLLEVIQKRKGMGVNSFKTPNMFLSAVAKKSASGFTISNHHLQSIASRYEQTVQLDISQPNHPRWCMF